MIATYAIALLIVAWLLDLFTPQPFVASILMNAPIALSSLARNRRLTLARVAAALLCVLSAGWFNAYREGMIWDPIAPANRVLSALTFLLVGFLSIAAQQSAQRAGEASARRAQAQQETRLRHSIAALRLSLDPEGVYRTMVREAVGCLQGELAVFLQTAGGSRALQFRTGAAQESAVSPALAAELGRMGAPALTERVVLLLEAGGATAELLTTAGVRYAMIVPIVDRGEAFGVLFVGRSDAVYDTDASVFARAFADQAAAALAQARVFAQLAEKNEDFARTNTALARRNEVIRDIVYALSHDLRTPLAAAGMTMRQARAGAFGELPGEYRDVLLRSIESTDELQRLAETLLLVARYESGEQSQARASIDLGAIAAMVSDHLRALAAAKGVVLTLERPGTAATVWGDESELRRAATNLIANAIAWTPGGGTVAVRVGQAGENVHLDVEDDGYGVPDDLRASLFERFSRAPSRRGAGTGLGLYLVKRIAESHGGTIAYRPREPRGSAFSIELPRESG